MLQKNVTISSILVAMVLVVIPVLGIACRATMPDFDSSQPEQVVREVIKQVEVTAVAPIHVPEAVEISDEALVGLYARVNPAVVNITVYTLESDLLLPASQGSGFLFDDLGHIITNAHVVRGADQVEVTFSDSTVRIVDVIGEDPSSDLAVLKVENVPAGVLPLTLGNMEDLAVGQSVVAIGNPFGQDGTLTRGIISALGRTRPSLTPFLIPEAIQTDAAINPGNSGGPLMNLRGEVIGVNAQIISGGDTVPVNLGIGFAIPVSLVKIVVPDLIEKGVHEWAWLGVRGGSVTPPLVEAMKLPVEKGAYMSQIIEGGPSDKAGLRGSTDVTNLDGRQVEIGGDVIIAINGQPVNSFDDLLVYVALNSGPGQEVTLTIVRGGKQQDITVTLEKRPASLNSE